ncbi:MAG: hypothetical protein AAF202_03715, partial [Pseudomonadota bacterium]
GQIIEVKTNSGRLQIQRDFSGRLRGLTWNTKQFLIKTGEFGVVTLITSTNENSGTSYHYEKGNLIKVMKSKSLAYQYGYDDYHNMTSIVTPRLSRTLEYNLELDSVTKIRDQDGCWQARQQNKNESRIQMSCGTEVTTLIFDKNGRLLSMHRPGLGKATLAYDSFGKLESLTYQPPNDTERRYSTQKIPTAARGSTKLDTLIALATTMTQAI